MCCSSSYFFVPASCVVIIPICYCSVVTRTCTYETLGTLPVPMLTMTSLCSMRLLFMWPGFSLHDVVSLCMPKLVGSLVLYRICSMLLIAVRRRLLLLPDIATLRQCHTHLSYTCKLACFEIVCYDNFWNVLHFSRISWQQPKPIH